MSFTPLFRRWGGGVVPFKKEMESQYHGMKKKIKKKKIKEKLGVEPDTLHCEAISLIHKTTLPQCYSLVRLLLLTLSAC